MKDLLENQGISCEIRGEDRASLGPGLTPPADNWPELWVIDESKIEQARQIIQESLESPEVPAPAWSCPGCHEQVDGQFSECWNCGLARP